MAPLSQHRPTVLIVEPQRLLADLLAQDLSRANLQVVSVTSIYDPVEVSPGIMPDVCLVDMDLANVSSFLQHIRSVYEKAVFVGLASETSPRLPGIDLVVFKDAGLTALRDAIRPYLTRDNYVGVLVVDDELEIRELVAEFLTSRGYAVFTAADGNDAIRVVEGNRNLDVVLLDLRMPGRGGMEVLKEIRDLNPNIGVIMITAIADREVASQAITIGAFDYVVKPFDMRSVENLIDACVGRAVLRRQSWWKRLIS